MNGKKRELLVLQLVVHHQLLAKQVLTGFEVSQTTLVTVRAVDAAGVLVDELGKAGATNISGPEFTIDNDDTLKIEARQRRLLMQKTKQSNSQVISVCDSSVS